MRTFFFLPLGRCSSFFLTQTPLRSIHVSTPLNLAHKKTNSAASFEVLVRYCDNNNLVSVLAHPSMTVTSFVEAASMKLQLTGPQKLLRLQISGGSKILDQELKLSKVHAIDNFPKLVLVYEPGNTPYDETIGIDESVWLTLSEKAQLFAKHVGAMRSSLSTVKSFKALENCMDVNMKSTYGITSLRAEGGRICVGSVQMPNFDPRAIMGRPRGAISSSYSIHQNVINVHLLLARRPRRSY